MTDTVTLIKQQFAALCQQRDAALAKSLPLRDQRDALIQQTLSGIEPQLEAFNREIGAIEDGLPDIMNQIATISAALSGQTS
jgi:hypothetical protein